MRPSRVALVVLGAGVLALAAPGGVAQAHPLGNFTVNHYDHLQLTPEAVTVTSVLDRAEIPTAQQLQTIAPDGSPTDTELADAAVTECADLGDSVTVTLDGTVLAWTAGDATLTTVPGAAGLPTLRLSCSFSSEAALTSASTVTLADDYLPDRVGWREMTADGDGVQLIDSPVPVDSITDQLRSYPVDLLASPVNVRSFSVDTRPGENTGTGTAITPGSGDPFTNTIAAADRRLEDLIGDRELTPLVGTLAVLLAVLLGCGHALLPGHGKTVMAAYLAGRDGRRRDALTVGATVTATHTIGVLALGLAISLSSTLAGDQVLRWLGVISGLLVAVIGITMLRTAVPRWHRSRATIPHDHDHDHDHDHPHDHDHRHDHDHAPQPLPALVGATSSSTTAAPQDHHTHDHHTQDDATSDSWWSGGHSHGPGGHTHAPGGHTHDEPIGRRGLIGMGIAGGLVPSPSALIVLLASIGLGRTTFGVVLVLAYGLGMAGTLTAVGLLLVRLRGRLARRAAALRRDQLLARLTRVMPLVTASLVLLVGLTLVVRGVVLA